MEKTFRTFFLLFTFVSLINAESLTCYLCGIETDSLDSNIKPCPIPFNSSNVDTCTYEASSTHIPICVVSLFFSS